MGEKILLHILKPSSGLSLSAIVHFYLLYLQWQAFHIRSAHSPLSGIFCRRLPSHWSTAGLYQDHLVIEWDLSLQVQLVTLELTDCLTEWVDDHFRYQPYWHQKWPKRILAIQAPSSFLQITRCCHKKLSLKSFFLLFSICTPNSKGLWYVRKIVRLEEIYLHNQENSRGLIIGKATLVWLSELRQAGLILSLLWRNFGLSFINNLGLSFMN